MTKCIYTTFTFMMYPSFTIIMYPSIDGFVCPAPTRFSSLIIVQSVPTARSSYKSVDQITLANSHTVHLSLTMHAIYFHPPLFIFSKKSSIVFVRRLTKVRLQYSSSKESNSTESLCEGNCRYFQVSVQPHQWMTAPGW